MGAAGDMLTAALLELLPDENAFLEKMASLDIPGVKVEAHKISKYGVLGTKMQVTVSGEEEKSLDDHGEEHVHEHEHEHYHSGLSDINSLIASLDLTEKVKRDAMNVYALLADAEGTVHGETVDLVHFHEVGALDAVADVVGVCLLMDMIGAEKVFASPVHVGSGYVRCAHGLLPVPAPATALLLKGIPTYGGRVEGELCTPTGAALLRYFVSGFGDMPLMKTSSIGYGMGTKDFGRLSCVRAFLGESEEVRERICKLECNLDDMTGEDLGFAVEHLFREGARDVYTQSIGMKKSRPGVLLSVLCLPEDADRFAALMMKYTSTIGVRRQDMDKYYMPREIRSVETEYGTVRVKRSEGMGVVREKAEYEDLAAIAEKNGVTLDTVRKAVVAAENGKADR